MRKLTLILLILASVFVGCEKEEIKPNKSTPKEEKVYRYWIIQLNDSATNSYQKRYIITNSESIRIDTTYKMGNGNLIPVNVHKPIDGDPSVVFVHGYWKYPMYPKDGITSGVTRDGI